MCLPGSHADHFIRIGLGQLLYVQRKIPTLLCCRTRCWFWRSMPRCYSINALVRGLHPDFIHLYSVCHLSFASRQARTYQLTKADKKHNWKTLIVDNQPDLHSERVTHAPPSPSPPRVGSFFKAKGKWTADKPRCTSHHYNCCQPQSGCLDTKITIFCTVRFSSCCVWVSGQARLCLLWNAKVCRKKRRPCITATSWWWW